MGRAAQRQTLVWTKKKRNPQVALNPPKEEGGGDKRRAAQEEEARQRQDGFCQTICCNAIDNSNS
jgi:hypothetical protein